jgi:transcriptional regulator with XRE-family HTH domain
MGRGKSADATDFWDRYENRTQKDFATSLSAHIKPSTLSTYKTEKRYPRANEAVAIARALGTTVEELVTGISPEGLPAEFLADCRLLHARGALGPVEDFARFKAGEAKITAEAIAKPGGHSVS